MSFITYYITHSFAGAVKKLFRSVVAVFIVCTLLFAVLGGVIGYVIGSVIPEDEPGEAIVEEINETEEEFGFEDDEELNEYGFTQETQRLILDIVESVLFTVSFAVSLIFIYTSDKSATKIFRMGDVNFLFPAPVKPQTVLLFRLIMQVSVVFLSSLYLLFQMPNIMKLGFNAGQFLILFAGWLIMIFFGRLLSVLVYTVTSTRITLRKFILPFVIVSASAFFLCIFAYSKYVAMPVYLGAVKLLSSRSLRFFPVFGWIKGFVMAFREGDFKSFALFLCLIALGTVALVYIIWKIKADFYEDALKGAEETEERLRLQKEGKHKRTKERKKKYESYDFAECEGAKVLFDRVMFCRKRFSLFGFFTKTGITYLFSGLLLSLLFKVVIGFDFGFYPFGILCGLFACFLFFRNLKNPINEETSLNFIFLIPESNLKKVFWSTLAGVTNSALDLSLGIIVSAVILKVDIILALAWALLLVTLEVWTTVTGVFIDMIMPAGIHQAIASMIAMWLRMFAALPGLILLALAFYFESTALVFAVAGVNLLLSLPIFFAASGVLRKTANE